MVAASGTTNPPSCPRFSAIPHGFSDQFRIGHYNYWCVEDVTYSPQEVLAILCTELFVLLFFSWIVYTKANYPLPAAPAFPRGTLHLVLAKHGAFLVSVVRSLEGKL